MSTKGKVWLGIMVTMLFGLTGWRLWTMAYWQMMPDQMATTIATQTGVIYSTPVLRGGYSYALVTAAGDVIGLSCTPEYSRYITNPCLDAIAERGLTGWRPDWRKLGEPGPVVEVAYVMAENRDERFSPVVYSVRHEGQEYLDPEARLAQAGIDPTGRTYSAFRGKQARLAARRAGS